MSQEIKNPGPQGGKVTPVFSSPNPENIVTDENSRAPPAVEKRQTRSSSKSPTVSTANEPASHEKKTTPTSSSNKSSKKSSKQSSQLRAQILAARAKGKKGTVAPVIVKDHLQEARDAKENIIKSTGVSYDLRMLQHLCTWDRKHPECPERLSSVLKRCEELGLLSRCAFIPSRKATKEEILTTHSEHHYNKLQDICRVADENTMEKFCSDFDSIYCNTKTFESSLLATGCTLDVVDQVVSGKVQNGMAIVRPPGHHAMKEEYCGYSFFNNVAIGANAALLKGCSKILIVDFDVHHGQGTQQAFYNDPRVLYFSTHRYEHGTFWPNLKESNYNFVGSSDGYCLNCNVPLNKTGMENTDFLTIWYQLLLPMAYQFNPDLVLVSAGYDAALGCMEFNPSLVVVSAGFDSALGDLKGEMKVTPQCYPHLIRPLMALANGKVAVVLEGGYCIQSLAEGAALTLRTLLGDPCPFIDTLKTPSPEICETILNLTYLLRQKWKLFLAQKVIDKKYEEEEKRNENIHFPTLRYDWNESKPEKYKTRGNYPVQQDEEIKQLCEKLTAMILNTNLTKATYQVGLLYDEAMKKHFNIAEPHPERPERISSIFDCHEEYGLIDRCHPITSREASFGELKLIHSEDHIMRMSKIPKLNNKELHKLGNQYHSVFFNNSSFESALIAAGSTVQVTNAVLDNTCQSAVAIVRPPGHHAEVSEPCGFCVFNNVALAAKYALEKRGLKRVMIVDWDVHFGNGIQRIFDSDPRVLYVSLHRYDHGFFFPCSSEADPQYVGQGAGKGYTVNIGWNRSGMGDTEYIAAFTHVILPIGYQFNPELVIVSAGFDAALGDPLGGCKVTPEAYAHMTHMLSSLAGGKIILALEGGYNLTSISYSMTLCTKALLGDPLPRVTIRSEVDSNAAHMIRETISVQSSYWSILTPFVKYFPSASPHQLVPIGTYGEDENTTDALIKQLEKLDFEDNSEYGTATTSSDITPTSEGFSSANSELEDLNKQTSEDLTDGGSSDGVQAAAAAMTELHLSFGAEEGAAAAVENGHVVLSNLEGAQSGCISNPLKWCPHVEFVKSGCGVFIDTSKPCEDCDDTSENWICLTCYTVHCSRFVNEHMLMHAAVSEHRIAMSFSDLSVWCYACDQYLDSDVCRTAQNSAHYFKFGEFLPNM